MKAPWRQSPVLPDWLEQHRLNDSLFQEAYERFGPEARSLIKTAIALAQFHFAPRLGISYNAECNPIQAFNGASLSWTANNAFLIFSPKYDAAALACAAAALPQLCGLPHIHAICLCEQPSFQILTTLELCGIEDVFCLNAEKCLQLIRGLSLPASTNRYINPARALLLDYNGSLRSLAAALGNILPILYLDKRPAVCLQNPPSWDRGLIHLLFGSEVLLEDDPSLCDALYLDSIPMNQEELAALRVPLILSRTCAAFWIFPELEPDFFKMRSFCFDLCAPCQI